MVAKDSSLSSITGVDTENNENLTPSSTTTSPIKESPKPTLSKFQQRLLQLKKPLNLSEAPEIDLKPVENEKEKPENIDLTTEWLQKTTGLKIPPPSTTKSPKLSTTSPKTLSKYRQRKKELREKIRQKTREEQALRYQMFNEDNEIFNEQNDDDDEEFDEYIDEKPKKKIVVNEDDEEINYIEENDVNDGDDEEEEVDDEEIDDEEVDDEEEIYDEDENDDLEKKNNFIDDEASEAEEAEERNYDLIIEEQEEKMIKNDNKKSRIIIEDSDDSDKDDNENDQTIEVEKESNIQSSFIIPNNPLDKINHSVNSELSYENESSVNESTHSKNPEDYLAVVLPDNPSQLVEPSDPVQLIEPQQTIMTESIETNNLLDLCSGNFEPLNESQLNVNPLDYISQNSFGTPDPILPYGTVNIKNSGDDTLAYIEKIQHDFEEADDTIVSVDSDSDSDIEEEKQKVETRKRRRIVNYSDDEEEKENNEPIAKKKAANLFDSDDDGEENEDINMKDIESQKDEKKEPEQLVSTDLLNDDFFTTDDDANERQTTRKWINDDDEEEEKRSTINDEEDFDDQKGIKNYFDEEAELSGDDIGPDDKESDEEDNEYEKDECDDEEYDENELRNQLAQQYNKQIQNEEYRRLLKLQELFIGDDFQTSNIDRSFRKTMRNEISDDDWQKLVQMNPVLANMHFEEDDDDEEDEETLKKSIEVKKWKMSQQNDKDETDIDIMADFSDSKLLSIGRQVLQKNTLQTKTLITNQPSFLNRKSNLEMLLKESKTTDTNNKHILFTSQK